jgi:hypothetical protein
LRSFYLRRSFSLTEKNHIGSILTILSMIDGSFLKEASGKIKALDNDSDISFFESKTNC